MNKSLWSKDNMDKIKTLPEYMEEIWKMKDELDELKTDEAEKEKQFNAARTRRRFKEDKIEKAYEGSAKFRK